MVMACLVENRTKPSSAEAFWGPPIITAVGDVLAQKPTLAR